jgi:hypothetical protein
MSPDAKAIQKLVDAYLAYEQEIHKALSPEEIVKIVEAERVKAEKEQRGTSATPSPARR